MKRRPLDTLVTELAAQRKALRRRVILEALAAEHGNRTRAAKRLGYTHETALFRAIKRLGLRVPKGHPGRPVGAKWSRAERQARMGS